MPMYKYHCSNCDTTFRSIVKKEKIKEAKTKECVNCGKEAKRVISNPSVHYKGSGFYSTDYDEGGDEE